jgi:hypothetical protein
MTLHSILATMSDKTDLAAIVNEEFARHPRMSVRDLQKLIYQGVFGGDHLLYDRQRFVDSLRVEWEALPVAEADGSGAPLQVIDPEARTARVHLLPCKARGVPVDGLLDLLISQAMKHGERSRFERLWNEAVRLARAKQVPFHGQALARLPFPEGAPRHTRAYGEAAYRIVNDLTEQRMREGLWRLGVLE